MDGKERRLRLARYMAMPEQRLHSLLLRILVGGACSRVDLAELDDILRALPGHDTLRYAVGILLAQDEIGEDYEQAFLTLIAQYFREKE